MTQLVLSATALVVSVIALTWTIYRHYRWNRPWLVVSGRWIFVDEFSFPHQSTLKLWELEISVVNVGDIESSIVDAYWEFEKSDGSRILIRGSRLNENDSFEIENVAGVVSLEGENAGQEFPTKIDRFTNIKWLITREVGGLGAPETLMGIVRGRPVVYWIARKAAIHPLGENPHIVKTVGSWKNSSSVK